MTTSAIFLSPVENCLKLVGGHLETAAVVCISYSPTPSHRYVVRRTTILYFSPFETEHKTPFRTPKNIKLRQPKDKTFTTLWCESSPGKHDSSGVLLARSQARPVNCQYGSVSTVQRKQDHEWKTKECILYYAFSYQTSLSPPSCLSAWNTFRIHLLHENRRQFPIGFPPCTTTEWLTCYVVPGEASI